VEYLRFDPSGCGFPKPRAPVLPPLGRRALGRSTGEFALLCPDKGVRFYARGRYALTEALRLSGVGPHGAVLVPAYHCRTMLDPATRLQAPIILYPVKPDLSPDLQALAACLAASPQPVKALLLTHYFGFAQELASLVGFCEQHGLVLIEDCSHALFAGQQQARGEKYAAIGRTGLFCVASPYKFFASEDGGMLWANGGGQLPPDRLAPVPLAQEFKELVHSVQRARVQNQKLDLPALDREIHELAGKPVLGGRDTREQSPELSEYYETPQEHSKGLAWSRWIVRHTDTRRLADRRRQHYLQWVDAVAGMPHCKALYPQLPDACVPYMFGLQIDHPEVHFFALKQLGVPVWRWDDMAVSDCETAMRYRLSMLHLPCHQELSPQQMSWLTTAVRQVMSKLPIGNR
jgi:hypothetical protein